MGQTCCRSKLDEGIVYDDDYYKDFYQINKKEVNNNEVNEVDKKVSFKSKPKSPIKSKETNEIKESIETNNINQSMNLLKSFNKNLQIQIPEKEKKERKDKEDNEDNKNTIDTNLISEINTSPYIQPQPQRTSIKKHVLFKPEPNGSIEHIRDENTTTISNPLIVSNTSNCISFLKLVVKESKHLTKEDSLKINQNGLVGTKRVLGNEKNVIFGHRKSPEDNSIDVSMHQEEGIAEKHFEIKYDKTLNKYFVNNVKHSGVFIKIVKNMQLRDGMIISFGTNHIHVSIINKPSTDQREVPSIIKFKAIYGSNKGQEL